MKAKSFHAADLLGWYGALAVLAGFFLSSRGLVATGSPTYLLLNASGAAGLIVESTRKRDYPTIALNGTWLLIALASLAQTLR